MRRASPTRASPRSKRAGSTKTRSSTPLFAPPRPPAPNVSTQRSKRSKRSVMRLAILDKGGTLQAKLIAQLVRFIDGFSPDIVKVFLYRKEMFGDYFQPMFHEVMRAESEWTAG